MAKRQVVVRARQLFEQRVDWLKFFREVLGAQGVARQVFRQQAEYLAFEQTEEFAEVERMMFRLKAERRNPKPKAEPERMLTIRVPESVHEAIRAEALDHQTTINKLCVAKLLQTLSQEAVPPLPKSRLLRMLAAKKTPLRELLESSPESFDLLQSRLADEQDAIDSGESE